MNNPTLNVNHKFIIWPYLRISMHEIIFGLSGFVVVVVFISIVEMYLQYRRKKQRNIKYIFSLQPRDEFCCIVD